MTATASLGWPAEFVGELDHRQLKAPRVKLRSVHELAGGGHVYCVDLRVRRPNAGQALPAATLHAIEHFLLEGFSRLLPMPFVSVGVMGCQTGFYLVFADEGRASVICTALAAVLEGMCHASAVPYAAPAQCGHWRNHDLAGAQQVAAAVLAQRPFWLEAA